MTQTQNKQISGRMLSAQERMKLVLAAPPRVLLKVDAVLTGADVQPTKDASVKTVTFSEAARLLGVSRPSVYRLVEAGRLKAVQLGSLRRVTLRSIQEFTA